MSDDIWDEPIDEDVADTIDGIDETDETDESVTIDAGGTDADDNEVEDADDDPTIPDVVDSIADDDGQDDAPDAEGIDEDEPDASDELPTEGEPTESEIVDEDLPDDDPDEPADINDNIATLPCIASVRQGDTVMVAMRNGEPTVIGSVGWGDRQDAAIGLAQRAAAAAEAVASQAWAVAEAVGQHFWTSNDGVHVTEVTQESWQAQESGRNVLINSLGILLRSGLSNLVSITQGATTFFDGLGNATANIVAYFGSLGAQIGRSDNSHLTLDPYGLAFADSSGREFFSVTDLRDADGSVTQTFVSSGGIFYRFSVSAQVQTVLSVTLDGVETSAYTHPNVYDFDFDPVPAAGVVVAIKYIPVASDESLVKSYTLGYRKAGTDHGFLSVAEGRNAEASGAMSHAESGSVASGRNSHAECGSTASGDRSHAEGRVTVASGDSSHAEGMGTVASGAHSHASGEFTIARGINQFVVGQYNVASQFDLFIVGDGADEDHRHNALVIDMDGNVSVSGAIGVAGDIRTDGVLRAHGGDATLTGNASYIYLNETGTSLFRFVKSTGAIQHYDGSSWVTFATPDIGTIESGSASGVSVANNTATALASVTLAAGTWVIEGNAGFASSATGVRTVTISATSADMTSGTMASTGQRAGASPSGYTYLHTTYIVSHSAQTTYYLNVLQTSGGALSTGGRIRAVRIA